MSMDFSGAAGATTAFDLIPNGQLAWVYVNVIGLKPSASGGAFIEVELTVDEGQPFARRKVFDRIGDPANAGNTENYRQMGQVAICRMLEAGRGAGPNNLAGYRIDSYGQLQGLKVAIRVGFEAGKDGFNDKNKVAEYLTPNPASESGHKGFVALIEGRFDAFVKQAPGGQAAYATGGFGQPAPAQAPAQATMFGNPQPALQGGQPAGGQSGFPQTGAPFVAGQPTTGNTGFASTTPATGPSPSDPAASPGWLQQANAGG